MSDWSSDVCTSDRDHEGGAEQREDEELQGRVDPLGVAPPADEEVHRHQDQLEHDEEHEQVERAEDTDACALEQEQPGVVRLLVVVGGHRDHREGEQQAGHDDQEQRRSEEHTSELQSLMRITYAVCCLKKKTIYTPT